MKWITHHGCTQENQSPGPTVVALGCFDGLHIAHKAIVSRAVLAAREHGGIPTIFTFDASSSVGGKQTPLLMDNASRFRRMREWGIEQIYYPPFSAVRDIPAEAFVREVLAGCCRAKMALCGFNFHFGKGGQADAGELQRLGAQQGIEVEVIPEILQGGQAVSSTRVRRCVQEGRMEEAAALLGHPFSLVFPVEHGRKLGRRLGFPTANQTIPASFIRPRFGVYVSQMRLDGRWYYGITNVGVKPTVGSDRVVAETWFPDVQIDVYGRSLEIYLETFLREERKFQGLDALQEQIRQDHKQAVAWLRGRQDWPENLPVTK